MLTRSISSTGEAAVGEAGFTNPQGSSAAEYVMVNSDGSLGIISDETDGIGLLKLAALSGSISPSPSPVPSPSLSPVPSPSSSPAPQPKILMIGDSSGEFAGYSLADYCSGATVVNQGISGSTAAQWGATGGTQCGNDACCGENGAYCSAANAFSSQFGSGYTHAWIGVGGNDLLDSAGCSKTTQELTTLFTNVVNEVKSSMPTGLKILATGYCQTTSGYSDCTEMSAITRIHDAWRSVAATDTDVTFISSLTSCGGSLTSWSPSTYHRDQIHFNNKGYCKIWTMPEVQSFLGCYQATYDCDSVSETVSATMRTDVATSGTVTTGSSTPSPSGTPSSTPSPEASPEVEVMEASPCFNAVTTKICRVLLTTTYYLLLTTYYSLLTTYYSLLTTHYLLLTTDY